MPSSEADRLATHPLFFALLGLAVALLAVAALPTGALQHFSISNALVIRRQEAAYAGLAVLGGLAIGVIIGLLGS